MRPLVLPDPLPAQPDVYTTPADDFLLLIQDQSSLMSTAQSALDSLVNQATDPVNDIGADLDALGQCWDGVDQTFGKLNESISDVDLTSIIAQVAAIENIFDAGVLGWALDLTSFALPFVNAIEDYVYGYFNEAWDEASYAVDIANTALSLAQQAFNGGYGTIYSPEG